MSTMMKKIALTGLMAFAAAAPALPLIAQQAAPTPRPAVATEQESATPNKPGSEGITVHGHWIMDLKDKDGKVIEHRDFQNALSSLYGPHLLIRLLLGDSVLDTFVISGTATDNSYLYSYPAGSNYGTNCNSAAICFPNMTTSTVNNGSYLQSIVLSGSMTPTASTTLKAVNTIINYCSTDGNPQPTPTTKTAIAPSQCTAGSAVLNTNSNYVNSFNFTGTGITPITVAAGQTLAITVTLSFS